MKNYSKKDISKIYEHYREYNNEMASEKVGETYDAHNNAFEEYIAAIVEDSFSKGFRYALKMVEEDKTMSR